MRKQFSAAALAAALALTGCGPKTADNTAAGNTGDVANLTVVDEAPDGNETLDGGVTGGNALDTSAPDQAPNTAGANAS